VLVGMSGRGPGSGPVTPGVLHVARPFDANWQLRVDGQRIAGRIAFSGTTAFDVGSAGNATLTYSTSTGRHLAVLLQAAGWLALAVAASRIRWDLLRRKRRVAVVSEGPLLSLNDLQPTAPESSAEVPGADLDVDGATP